MKMKKSWGEHNEFCEGEMYALGDSQRVCVKRLEIWLALSGEASLQMDNGVYIRKKLIEREMNVETEMKITL